METSMVNFTTVEEYTNSTSHATELLDSLGNLGICFYIISLLFGLPTFSYMIFLIVTGTGSGVASEFFILNLCVCELGQCLNSLFALLTTWLSLKTVALIFFGFFFTGRPVFECLISVERYLAVVHPVTFLKFKPLRYRLICSAVAWIICLVSCLCCVLLMLNHRAAYKGYFSSLFFLFLSIQMFCCVAVLRALKQSGPGERGREREEENNMKRRAFNLILITAVSMFITYLPYVILGLFSVMTSQLNNILWIAGLICYVLCGFVQPVFYLTRAGKLCFCLS